MSPLDGLVVLFLILVNALYVAAEFAAVAARRSRIRQLAEGGQRVAARLLPVLDRPERLDRYIATSQVGITLSSLTLGAYGQATIAVALAPRVADWLELESLAAYSVAATGVLLGLTALQVIFGELVPKSLALQHATPLALATYWPMQWTLAVLGWFINFLNGSGLLLLRLLRAPETRHRHVHSSEEIELLMAESREGGLLDPDEFARLQRAFRFSRRTARDLMMPRDRLTSLDIGTPLDVVYAEALTGAYTHVPVIDGSLDRVVGMLSVKPLLVRRLGGRPITDLHDVLHPPLFVNDRITGDRLMALLSSRRARQAIVQDAAGRVIGMVSVDDLLSTLLSHEP